MRLFITGGVGYLGRVLIRHGHLAHYTVGASYFSAPPEPDEHVVWTPLDVRDRLSVEETLDQFAPDVVIHTAFRQSGPDLMATTADGAGNVAHAAAAIGARLIHMSSDVIFDGERAAAYTEDDPPAPISPYGEAKARAEALVQAIYPEAVVVRTSLIYGFNPIDRQTLFALEVASGERQDRLFTDEFRCPIYVEDLAAALIELAGMSYSGILHLAGAESVSRYELGVLLARACGYDPANIPAGLSAESPTPRPRNCVLDCSRAHRMLHTPLRGVRQVLRDLGRADGS